MTQTITTQNPKIIDGRQIAEKTLEELAVRRITDKTLIAVSVGADKATHSFLKAKAKSAETLGIGFDHLDLDHKTTTNILLSHIRRLTKLDWVGGIILQLPIPDHLDLDLTLSEIPAEKDVDLIGHEASGRFYNELSDILPPALSAVITICQSLNISLAESMVAVIGGGGKLIGRPLAIGLAKKVKKLTLIDHLGKPEMASDADIVICGTGIENLIDPKILKPGCVVIDFGYTGKGDMRKDDPESLERLRAWTTNPGGTGPVLVAEIIRNFVELTS